MKGRMFVFVMHLTIVDSRSGYYYTSLKVELNVVWRVLQVEYLGFIIFCVLAEVCLCGF